MGPRSAMRKRGGGSLRGAWEPRPAMPFRTRPHEFSIGLAPSGRARCRGCKRLVGKGELRIVTRAFVMPGRARDLVRHTTCVTAVLAKAMLAAHGSMERVPASAEVDAAALGELRSRLSELACG